MRCHLPAQSFLISLCKLTSDQIRYECVLHCTSALSKQARGVYDTSVVAERTFPGVPQSFGSSGGPCGLATPGSGGTTRPPPSLGASPAARRPCIRPMADVRMPSQPLTNAELTTILHQVTAQMTSDHSRFGQVTDDLNDNAGRLDKFCFIYLTNKVDQ